MMEVIEVPVSDIKVKFRLRNPSEEKVSELADSIEECSLLNPVTIDPSHNLIAGYHRVLAFQKLGRETIPAIVKEADEKYSQLMEISENLVRSELSVLDSGFHIVKREELLSELGLTYTRGDNRFTSQENKLTQKDLSESIGLGTRSYARRKQIAIGLNPEVKDLLVDTEFADDLKELLKLSVEPDDIQLMVCNLLITGKCKTWKAAFIQSKYAEFKLRSRPKFDFDFKERFGSYPQSIMQFKKSNDDLRKVCNLVNHSEELRHQKGSLNFGETEIKLHQMEPNQCVFALDYYTQENDLILDPFNGRGTTAITALHLNRRAISFEINDVSYRRTTEVIQKNVETTSDRWKIIKGDGCDMDYLKDESNCIDAVFTSPPYYGSPEPYNNDPRDLCNMSIEDFDKRIDVMFSNLKRLIKRSDYKKKIFHPMIFVVGTYRNNSEGIYDMDASFQNIAKSHGLKLWDKQMIQVHNPHLVCSIQRNFELKFTHKNYETSLVFCKF